MISIYPWIDYSLAIMGLSGLIFCDEFTQRNDQNKTDNLKQKHHEFPIERSNVPFKLTNVMKEKN